MTEIISRNVNVGSCTVHCLQTKNTQGYDIVLLHGAKFQAATWKELKTLNRLGEAGYRPYAIDLPGFGKSPRGAVSHDAVLQAFIKQEKLSRPVIVGPSMSGKISLDFTLEHPETVGGLVLIGAVGVRERSEELNKINLPCLIVWGSKDNISPMDNGRLLHQKIRGAELQIFDNAGHPCYLDQPDQWHHELLLFLNKHFGLTALKEGDSDR
jgi:abhydrolase domain-containing protein 14